MKNALLYIHGKGGSSHEAEQYKPLCIDCDVYGLDFDDFTPWGTREFILNEFKKIHSRHEKIFVLANSIGAYFSMLALQHCNVERAFFVSPILDMGRLILGMMKLSGVTEHELSERGEIETDYGETLSWKYLCYVRDNPVKWNIPTEILYAENDNLTPYETVKNFVRTHDAKLTVMEDGEHWFHTPEQMKFLYQWLKSKMKTERKE